MSPCIMCTFVIIDTRDYRLSMIIRDIIKKINVDRLFTILYIGIASGDYCYSGNECFVDRSL